MGSSGGTCQTPDPAVVDAGEPDDEPDAGEPDAGVRDDGLAVRGTLQVAPGELRGGSKALRGQVLGTGPATTVRGGTLIFDAALNGAPP